MDMLNNGLSCPCQGASFFPTVSALSMEEHFSVHQPKPKLHRPQGQLAAMLQSRGAWDALDYSMPARDINRSSSAPPIQLLNDDADYAPLEQHESPTTGNWNMWSHSATTSPMRHDFDEQNQFYVPNTSRMNNWNRNEFVSPLRTSSAMDGAKPGRQKGSYEEYVPAFPKPKSALGFRETNVVEHSKDDELRMRALLNAAMDSRDDLFPNPTLRAASTPPTRLLNRRAIDDLAVEVGNVDIDGNDSYNVMSGPHTVTGAQFPPYAGYPELVAPRAVRNTYEQDYPIRPASAQGRFVSAPPPGFGGSAPKDDDQSLDPAVVIATLTAAGNLTPVQIQQIENQLRKPNPVASSSWDEKKRPHRKGKSVSPTRSKHSSTTSEGSPHSRSAVLEEFRNSKSKKYELSDIAGAMVEFSTDQHGSRFIQQKLENATLDEKQMVFDEIVEHALVLTTDVFGNYVIQKFFEHGTKEHRETLARKLEGHVVDLSLQMYGCRVVQKAFEFVTPKTQVNLVTELNGHVLKCVKDQNGNHVIQKAVEKIPHDKVRFIIDSFQGQVYNLATHPYGCRVIQRIFEYCNDEDVKPLLEELNQHCSNLIQDQYGNYVIQHILEKGKPKDKAFIITKVKGNVLNLSRHKFASNVVEKCVAFGTGNDRKQILDEILQTKPDGTTPVYVMMKDQFANYVVQKLLEVASEKQKIMLVTKIKTQLPSLKKLTYEVEKYIQQYNIE